jgi:hypothetical protein
VGASNELTYEKTWPNTDVLALVRHGDNVVLVSILPDSGKVLPLASLPDVQIGSNAAPEAAVLRTSEGIFVGWHPRQVAIDEQGSTAAVVVSDANGTAVQTVNLRTGAISATTPVPNGLEIESMMMRNGRIFALGGTKGLIISVEGGTTTDLALPGLNVTSVWN